MSPSASTSIDLSTTESTLEQDIIGGFGFALGGVIASVFLIWFGGKQIKKVVSGK